MRLLPGRVQKVLAGGIVGLIATGGAGVFLMTSGGAAAVGAPAHASTASGSPLLTVCITVHEINLQRTCIFV